MKEYWWMLILYCWVLKSVLTFNLRRHSNHCIIRMGSFNLLVHFLPITIIRGRNSSTDSLLVQSDDSWTPTRVGNIVDGRTPVPPRSPIHLVWCVFVCASKNYFGTTNGWNCFRILLFCERGRWWEMEIAFHRSSSSSSPLSSTSVPVMLFIINLKHDGGVQQQRAGPLHGGRCFSYSDTYHEANKRIREWPI